MSDTSEQQPVVVRRMSREEEAEVHNEAIWKSRLEAQQKRTESLPGGFYLDPNGNPVNANGEPLNRSVEELERERDELNASLPPLPYA